MVYCVASQTNTHTALTLDPPPPPPPPKSTRRSPQVQTTTIAPPPPPPQTVYKRILQGPASHAQKARMAYRRRTLPPLLFLPTLLLFVLSTLASTAAAAATKREQQPYGKFTCARTPLKMKMPTGAATPPKPKQRGTAGIGTDPFRSLAHAVTEHPAQAAMLGAIVYLKVAHPELAVSRHNHFAIDNKEVKALAILWFAWNVEASWFTEAGAWLRKVWSGLWHVLSQWLRRLAGWWKRVTVKEA